MLNKIIKPALRADGFVGSRKILTRSSADGDLAVVEFQTSAGSIGDDVSFYINVGVAPAAWRAWWDVVRGAPLGRTGSPLAEGLWRTRVEPSPGCGDGSRWWVATMGAAERCGPIIVERLQSESIPRMLELLDRERFLQEIRDQGSRLPGLATHPFVAALALLLDGEPSAERDQLVTLVQEINQDFSTWAAEHIALRAVQS
jgi:hypothetical protein